MKNKRLEERRSKISKDIDIFVKQSFDIVDRIHEILVAQGKEQKDLATLLGKSESEISKWMTGTHNFTIKTLAKIEAKLGEKIIESVKEKQPEKSMIFYILSNEFAMSFSKQYSKIPMHLGTIIEKPSLHSVNCLN